MTRPMTTRSGVPLPDHMATAIRDARARARRINALKRAGDQAALDAYIAQNEAEDAAALAALDA